MPTPGESITGPDGQLRVWEPDTAHSKNWEYLQEASGFPSEEAAHQADLESGQGSYVPASNVTHWPWWLKTFVATGLGAAAATGLGAALAPGAFGGAAGAGAGAGSAATGAASSTLGSSPMAGVSFGGASGAAGAGGAGASTAVPLAAKGAGTLGTLGKLGSVGQILGGYQQGAAQGREREAGLNLQADTLRQRQVESDRQNAINQKTTGQDLEDQARRQAAWGEFVKAGPMKVTPPAHLASHMGTVSGGRPDMSSLGDEAYRAAQQRLLSGSDKQFPSMPTPALTPPPKSGWLDKLMQLGALGTGAAGALGGYRPPTTGGR
jgi:hypothetical protein